MTEQRKPLDTSLVQSIRALLPVDDREAAITATCVSAELCVATGIEDDDALVLLDAAMTEARKRGAGQDVH